MKKLNRKGFTLVELLAVIVILAIVVGISIPSVTSIINNSKNDSLGVALDAAEKYFTEQYSLMQVDFDSIDNEEFKSSFNKTLPIAATEISTTLMGKAGLDTDNVTTVNVSYLDSGAACVTVTKIPKSSQYYIAKYWDTNGELRKKEDGTIVEGVKYKSKSCS